MKAQPMSHVKVEWTIVMIPQGKPSHSVGNGVSLNGCCPANVQCILWTSLECEEKGAGLSGTATLGNEDQQTSF